jgi:phage baseplate assembly protein W
MKGINSSNGYPIRQVEHLKQSIKDILTTPIGSRVMRRDYGSRLYELVDAPLNDQTRLQIYAATAEALALWEPRFRLIKVSVESASQALVVLQLTGEYLSNGETISLDGVQIK